MKKILCFMLALSLMLCGCAAKEAPEECIAQAGEFAELFKAKDFEGMYAMTYYKDPYLAGTYDESSVIGSKLFDAMASNLTYEITGGERKGKNANVTLHIVTADFNTLLKNVVEEYTDYCKDNADTITDEEMSQVLESILDEHLKNITPYEKDTSIDFIKDKGKWVIEDNVGIYDDLSGGYLTYCFGVSMAMGDTAVRDE